MPNPMLQTRTLIIFAVLGLLLPLVLVAARQYVVDHQPDPLDCATLTEDLETLDNVSRLPEAPLLVLGDGTARHWPDSIAELAGQPVLNRAIQGTTVATVAACFRRMVAYYRPRHVVLFLEHRDRERLETELTDALQEINAQKDRFDVAMNLWVIGLIETPARGSSRVSRLNRAVESAAAALPGVEFIDFNPLLQNADGRPDHNHFWPDGDTLREASMPDLVEHLGGRLVGELRADNGL